MEWKTTPGSFLWLYGKFGCGKTILSSTITETVLDHCSRDRALAVVYFYFDSFDVKKVRQDYMLRSMVAQLLSQATDNSSDAFNSFYSSFDCGKQQPGTDRLLQVLLDMMDEFAETYLIIDGVDECDRKEELMEIISELARSRKGTNLHILVTSRWKFKTEVVPRTIQTHPVTYCIHSTFIEDDIRSYVSNRIQYDPEFLIWHRQPKVLKEIEERIVHRADGM